MWCDLIAVEQIDEIVAESAQKPVLIFKHSTRCGISHMVLARIERQWREEEMNGLKTYLLDVIRYRDVSNFLSTRFAVEHESPQILIIHHGVSVLDRSHSMINYPEIASAVRS